MPEYDGIYEQRPHRPISRSSERATKLTQIPGKHHPSVGWVDTADTSSDFSAAC